MKLTWAHADTCLPDYWGGHHLPHVAIYAAPDMTIRDVRDAIAQELIHGAVMGNSDEARLLSGSWVKPGEEKRADLLTKRAYSALKRITSRHRRPFRDVEQSDDGDSVMAFFVGVIE